MVMISLYVWWPIAVGLWFVYVSHYHYEIFWNVALSVMAFWLYLEISFFFFLVIWRDVGFSSTPIFFLSFEFIFWNKLRVHNNNNIYKISRCRCVIVVGEYMKYFWISHSVLVYVQKPPPVNYQTIVCLLCVYKYYNSSVVNHLPTFL